MFLRQSVASQIGLVHIDRHASDVSFQCPCIDKDPNISATFQKRIQIGYVLLPAYAILPMVDIHRFTMFCQAILGTTVMPYSERSHETHQFHGRLIIRPGDDTDHLLQFHAIHRRKLLLAFSDIQQINARGIWQYKTRPGFIPAISIRSYRNPEFDGNVSLIFRQCYLLQDNTAIHQMIDTVRSRSVKSGGIYIRSETYAGIIKYLYGIISHRQ